MCMLRLFDSSTICCVEGPQPKQTPKLENNVKELRVEKLAFRIFKDSQMPGLTLCQSLLLLQPCWGAVPGRRGLSFFLVLEGSRRDILSS